jgi:O-antigen ligase
MDDWRQEAGNILPGLIGAIVALRWVGGSPLQTAAALCGGTAASYYGGTAAAGWLGVSVALAGFVVGLFGMAISSRIFEAIAAIPIGRVIEAMLKKLGL